MVIAYGYPRRVKPLFYARLLRALDWLYGTWLPQSGFAPDHQPCFEAWVGEPFAYSAHFTLRLQLAVVDANTPL